MNETNPASPHTCNGNKNKDEKKLTVLESRGYTVGKTIGVGTYATVKVAKSSKHGGLVAVKIISKFQAPSANLSTFLPREIEVVKGLRHPYLIRFMQAIETSHRLYIIMEYAENGSLFDIIRREKYIDENRSRIWFRQLLEALDYCHNKGVVHRDVKCENLLIDRYYNLKLSDFGFARGYVKPSNSVVLLCKTFCGSFAYASPEILRSIPYQPQLSDIWSSGVVLYTMVFGTLPFDESNWSKLLKQVQSKVVFPKSPKVSNECRNLIQYILVPQAARPKIVDIQKDPWISIATTTAHTSTEDIFLGESSNTNNLNTNYSSEKLSERSKNFFSSKDNTNKNSGTQE
ncbi:PREDICTED: testis-specific serine/threonine-protein kinase 4 [Ceratosolen solmsi marchali]|uniref:Testis-specific serine/threonine-protein kinase 4 n=1 Tax=Ceratosolen solmsi marchali TaxID=326594 RepID=A0AAJ6YX72_9HYME|nr:PREDICTED: testis-specific serine/threonine-protein kinase 4 [Ceratosolen solmsi marchali]